MSIDTTTPVAGGAEPLSEDQLAAQAFGEQNAVPEGDDVAAATGAEGEQVAEGDDGAGEGSIETWDQLVQELGVKPEDLMGLKYKLKIDGEDKEVTLGDLVKVNQLEGHVNKRSMELAEQRKAWESEREQYAKAYQERLAVTDQVLNGSLQAIQQQAQQLEASGLAQTDPAQYLMLKDQLNNAWQATHAQRQAIAQNYQQTQQHLLQQATTEAEKAIRQQHPDLADPASYSNALASMKAYLKEVGVNEQNMSAMQVDPVVFSVVRDAMRYRELQKAKPQVTNRVRTAPAVGKPSSKIAPLGSSARAQTIVEAARKGNEAALAEWLANS